MKVLGKPIILLIFSKGLLVKGDLDDITCQPEADYESFAYSSIQDTMTNQLKPTMTWSFKKLTNAIIIKDFQSIQQSQYVRIVHDKNTDVILTMNYKSN